MYDRSLFRDVPDAPGIYGFYRQAGTRKRRVCAYIGMAGSSHGRAGVKTRLIQHLVEQTSTTGSRRNAAGLFIERLTHVIWWIDRRIRTKVQAQAAELVAMEVERPLLRTESNIHPGARTLAKRPGFRRLVTTILRGSAGVIVLPNLDNTARRTRALAQRMRRLEDRVARLESRAGEPTRDSRTRR